MAADLPGETKDGSCGAFAREFRVRVVGDTKALKEPDGAVGDSDWRSRHCRPLSFLGGEMEETSPVIVIFLPLGFTGDCGTPLLALLLLLLSLSRLRNFAAAPSNCDGMIAKVLYQ